MTEPSKLPPLLLPRPRSLRQLGPHGGGGRDADPTPHARVGDSTGLHHAGEYRLSTPSTPPRIEAADAAGHRHALATLAQLRTQYGNAIPRLEIHDYPAFTQRGFMLDISRDRVPTMEHLEHIAAILESLKLNHLQLYTEHTFAYAGHGEVWAGCSPMTPPEVRSLDATCRGRGITLAANQNCFGHLKRWLSFPRYAHLAETHGEWTFMEWPRSGPFSLCPLDPGSLPFVEGLLDQLLPCFSSGLVNIGCDETFDVGQGRSREAVERGGRAAVYFDFVRAVAGAARQRGFRPMFWADIALHHPESVHLIPEDMIALAWGYEPDARFEEWVSILRAAGREAWVCPGTSAWLSITGRTSERKANILAAARAGGAGGAAGFLLTEWGDMGHRQQWPITLRAIADGAEAAWNGAESQPADDRAVSLHLFGDGALAAAAWLDELGDCDLPLRAVAGKPGADGSPTPLRNASALFRDLHAGLSEPFPNDPAGVREADAWQPIVERIETLAANGPGFAAATGQCAGAMPALLCAEMAHTVWVASVAAERAVLRRRAGHGVRAAWTHLASHVGDIIGQHRRLWLVRSREGGLADSGSYYKRIRDELRGAS